MNESQVILDTLALQYIPGIGSVLAKTLVVYTGEAGQIFLSKKKQLLQIPGIGEKTIESIINYKDLAYQKAEAELKNIYKHQIKVLHYTDPNYPRRLKQCTDSPTLLFYKGDTTFNQDKSIAIVGTRRVTEYGKRMIAKLIEDLETYNIQFISGLAYGVDACMHQECNKKNIQNIAVLGHGLHTIYPPDHKKIADKTMEHGAIISEYTTDADFNKENFPQRNRIIAGMADATIIIETGLKGGSIITAHLALGYHRNVMAFPGKSGDIMSSGCNELIKNHTASLIENAGDLVKILNWQKPSSDKSKTKAIQRQLFVELEPTENAILQALYQKDNIHIDELSSICKLNIGELAVNVLQMELKGLLIQLPGNIVKIC